MTVCQSVQDHTLISDDFFYSETKKLVRILANDSYWKWKLCVSSFSEEIWEQQSQIMYFFIKAFKKLELKQLLNLEGKKEQVVGSGLNISPCPLFFQMITDPLWIILSIKGYVTTFMLWREGKQRCLFEGRCGIVLQEYIIWHYNTAHSCVNM